MSVPPIPSSVTTTSRKQQHYLCSTTLGNGLTSIIVAIPPEVFEGPYHGAIFGTLVLAAIVGGAVGPWVTGALHDVSGSYSLAFWITIKCNALSTEAIWLAGPRKVWAVAGRVHPRVHRSRRD
jgi:hypothetical protein